MYKYFISYNYAFGNRFGFGQTETKTDFKITGIDKIRGISESIEKQYGYPKNSVMIINFKPFGRTMEQHIEYALEVISVEILKLQKSMDNGHFLPDQIEAMRLDIQRLNQSVTDIRERFNE